MTRIAVISDLWPPFPGGAERFMFTIARHAERAGHDVHVLTGYEAAERFDGPPFRWEPVGIREHHHDGWERIARYLADRHPDVIVAHHLYAYEFADEFAATGIPFVHIVHNTGRVGHADLAVYNSRYTADMCGDMRAGDMIIVPPVTAADVPNGFRAGTAIGMVKPLPHKGIAIAYTIADLMPEREFVILRGEWQDLEVIEDRPNVTFMEPVTHMSEFYGRCRTIIMPSLSEDAGTIPQESAMYGIPCITSNVGGLPEANGGGITLAATNPYVWVTAIRLLDSPRIYRAVVDDMVAYQARIDAAGHLDTLVGRIVDLPPVSVGLASAM